MVDRRAATLTNVNRWMRRAAAGTLAALVFAPHCTMSASAAPEIAELQVQNCADYPATAVQGVLDAWHIKRLGMDSVWPLATGKGIKVAVIDTGVSTAGTLYLPSERIHTFDLLPPHPEDTKGIDCDHGTAVVSRRAPRPAADGRARPPPTHIAGIAPDAEIFAYRTLYGGILRQGQQETLQPAIAAFRHAIDQGVDVINFSQIVGQSDPHFDEFQEVVREAISRGIVVVAAAGNQGQRDDPGFVGRAFPAGFEDVIAVGASGLMDEGNKLTMVNPKIDIGAPGVGLVRLHPSLDRPPSVENQAFNTMTEGTSFAAPLVSGVVALMLQYHRERYGADPEYQQPTPREIRARLMMTADPPPSTIPDKRIGFGIVNPLRALTGTLVPLDNPSAQAVQPIDPFPEPEDVDQTPQQLGLAMGAAAVALAAFGVGAAIAIPAARRSPRP